MARAPRPASFPIVLVLAALVAALVPAPAAPAQGMSELPGPITTRTLDRYAQRLDLSPEQRQAIELSHDRYLAEFRELRDGPIEAYLGDNSGFGMRMLFSPDPSAAKDGIRKLEDVLSKIEMVDRRFLDELQTVLADDQLPRMELVRYARERERHRSGMSQFIGWTNPASRVDLGVILDDLDLGVAEREAVDPIVAQYERSLTMASRRLNETALELPVSIVTKMQAAGLGQDSFRDRDSRQAMFDLWREAQLELTKQAADLASLNRRTADQVIPLLPSETAAKLRRQFLSTGYGEVPSTRGEAERHFRRALRFEEITDAQRTQLDEAKLAYETRADRVVTEMMNALDERRATQVMFDFNRSGDDARAKHEEKMDELRDRHGTVNEQAVATIEGILGTELAGRLATAEAAQAEGGLHTVDVMASDGVVMVTAVGAPGGGAMVSGGTFVLDGMEGEFGGDPYLPGPISRGDLDRFADVLALEDYERPILDSLHDDYRTQFDALKEGVIGRVRAAQNALWAVNDEGEISPPDEAAIEELYTLRRKAAASIMDTDALLFENIRAALLEDDEAPNVERLDLRRRRQIYRRAGGGGGMMLGGGGGALRLISGASSSSEGSIDLSRLVERTELPDDARTAIDPSLLEYEKAVTEAFRLRYEAEMRSSEAMEKMTVRVQQGGGRGGRGGRRMTSLAFGGGRGEDAEAAEAARVQITELNRSTLDTLLATLGPDEADRLKRAYERDAYPSIFMDPESAEPKLEAALKLGDLTGPQREELVETATAYRTEYDALCRKMLDLSAAAEPVDLSNPGRVNWQAMQEQRRAMETIRFDRSELSAKVITRLRGLLEPQQVEAIGGLDRDAPSGIERNFGP